MPNLALRNQSGVWYFSSEFQSGENGPAAMAPGAGAASASAARATPDSATAGMAAPMCFNKSLRFILSPWRYFFIVQARAARRNGQNR